MQGAELITVCAEQLADRGNMSSLSQSEALCNCPSVETQVFALPDVQRGTRANARKLRYFPSQLASKSGRTCVPYQRVLFNFFLEAQLARGESLGEIVAD